MWITYPVTSSMDAKMGFPVSYLNIQKCDFHTKGYMLVQWTYLYNKKMVIVIDLHSKRILPNVVS